MELWGAGGAGARGVRVAVVDAEGGAGFVEGAHVGGEGMDGLGVGGQGVGGHFGWWLMRLVYGVWCMVYGGNGERITCSVLWER